MKYSIKRKDYYSTLRHIKEDLFWHENDLKRRREDKEKEQILAAALDDPEGRAELARAMIAPISNRLNYQAIGKMLLQVDELPPGALARFTPRMSH